MTRWRSFPPSSDSSAGRQLCLREHLGRPAAAERFVQIDQRGLPITSRVNSRALEATTFEFAYDEVLVITKGRCTVRTEGETVTAQVGGAIYLSAWLRQPRIDLLTPYDGKLVIKQE